MKTRYKLTPQMKYYDRENQQWSPYLMFFQAPNLRTEALNTDQYGFRFTYRKDTKINPYLKDSGTPVNLLVGGSFVYGVGASKDNKTIASLLNADSQETWLNFGGRAFSSTQELLLFQFFHQKINGIKKIIIMSGINNLVLHFMAQKQAELGAFFYQNQFIAKMNSIMSRKRKLAKWLFAPILGEKIDYAHCTLSELIKSSLGKQVTHLHHTDDKTGFVESLNNETNNKSKIITIIERDILNWRLITKSLGIELHYVLQPFHSWIDKEMSNEERMLFSELDQYQGNDWKAMKKCLDKNMYQWFRQQVNDICQTNDIKFFDMNSALSELKLDKHWLFVDRIHSTDEGNMIIANIIKDKVLSP